jgi:hypothetical protein
VTERKKKKDMRSEAIMSRNESSRGIIAKPSHAREKKVPKAKASQLSS